MSSSFKGPPDYPPSLAHLPDPPHRLYYEGDWNILKRPTFGVVGARQMQLTSREWLENELTPFLKISQQVVVSGGARGVDQMAHAVALRLNLPTVVVLPCGLDQFYPSKLEALRGHPKVLFLSEYPPGVSMRKHHFYFRNRIIAALSQYVLIIEASEKSGTLLTARYAMEQGREVLAIPGGALDPAFSGNNQLLYDGATMIRGFRDLCGLAPHLSQTL